MAYTIISQNNTTTTLSDENGNVITVPARVTLATSTDYTIKKVNNNSVDLESGDGKIIRGVPACVVLAGEGGGSGSVDYAKTVQRAETMPTANASNAGQQFLYSGESDANYTHDYIYENVASTTPASATGTQTTGSTLSDLTVDGETFWEELEEYEIPQQTGDYSFTYNGETGYWDYGDDYFDLSDFGVTYTGTPTNGDVLTISVTAPSATYAWTRVDVQPAGATYTAGNGISIDANNEISVADPVLVNKATGTNSLSIGGSATTAGTAINIGYNSSTNTDGVGIGVNASAGRGIAIGYYATSTGPAVAIGKSAGATAQVGYDAIAIGNGAYAQGNGRIQIGSGTNQTNNTVQVYSYRLLDLSDGTVPHARLTNAVVSNTVTIAVADWNGGTTCTKTISGLTATSVVWVAPDNASQSDYLTAGVYASAQAVDTITFTCTTTPTSALTVNVIYC